MTKTSDTTFEIDAEKLKGLDPATLFHQARLVPAIKDGKPLGMKVFAVKPDSMLARLGLANGDVVVSVGGMNLDAADLGSRWLFRLLPDRFEWTRDDGGENAGGADATVRGSASDVFLFLWGRRKLGDSALEFSGNDDLLVHWVENSAI